MHHLVRRARNDVFLDQRLDAVRCRLEHAEKPDAIGAVPILDPAQSFAFENRHQREQGREHDR